MKGWFQIERSYEKPAGSLLVGRQLEKLSNERYTAGGHLVRSYPDPAHKADTATNKLYRYSIVFVLRAHSPAIVNTDSLTTSITGDFQNPIRDIQARELFKEIQRAHFNINTHQEEREEQRLKLLEKKKNLSPSTEIAAQHNNESMSHES
jgi:hypothetical protein